MYHSARRSRPIQVLQVEDDPEWRQLVGRWVRRRGLTFHAVSSQAALRDYLARGNAAPRCIILDLGLGGEDGLAACRLLKGSPAYQAIPLIALTGLEISQAEVLRHGALHLVRKDERAEESLGAVLGAVLSQHEKSRGVIEADDIQLDPEDRTVLIREVARIDFKPGPFAAFRHLVAASPEAVPDAQLYGAFLERHAYSKPDHELSVRGTLRNYVSRLRLDLGPRVGKRIVRRPGGYAYVPAKPFPRL